MRPRCSADRASGATVMQATPTLWQALVSGTKEAGNEAVGEGFGGSPLAGLRMLVGGEALAARCRARARLAGSVSNLYGPTETTIWSAAMTLNGTTLSAARRDGALLDDWHDRAGASDWSSDLEHPGLCSGRGPEPVPAGVAGELYIAGAVWRGAIWGGSG